MRGKKVGEICWIEREKRGGKGRRKVGRKGRECPKPLGKPVHRLGLR